MKTTHKKLVGALLVSILIGTIGVAFVTGQTDSINDETIPQIRFWRNKWNEQIWTICI